MRKRSYSFSNVNIVEVEAGSIVWRAPQTVLAALIDGELRIIAATLCGYGACNASRFERSPTAFVFRRR